MSICLKFVLLLSVVTVSVKSNRPHGYSPRKVQRRQTEPCDPSERFRRPDGTCNNLQNPLFGSAGSPMLRFLPNAYDDGVSSPRNTGRNGYPLISPRKISLNAHGASGATSDVTLMVMQWGQFLDHDISVAPHDADPGCCESDEPECFNIQIPLDDDYFRERDCMPFIRSLRTDVNGSAEQMNALTAFIDGSMIYGSSAEHMKELRDPAGGLLRYKSVYGSKYLPEAADDACRNVTGEHCFEAGDERVNEQPGLQAFHTIFMREHNRIANGLRKRNRHWDYNQIFEVARDIVATEIQHITYNDFLPLVLGPVFMEVYSLKSDSFTYNEEKNPGIRNEFATAAFRFGHSLIPEEINGNNEVLMLKDLFFKPTPVLESLDELSAGLSKDKSMAMDRQFSHSITRHLFQEEERTGFDLIALNIQRGRDHGIQPFNQYRNLCSGIPYKKLEQLFPGDTRAQASYEHIDDVDLFTGGVSEAPVEGGLVGPTFACLMGVQFNFLKHCDRFFYLNRNRPNPFNSDQRRDIMKISLAKIICDNTEINRLQENVFLPASRSNSERDCRDIPGIDLDNWIDHTGGAGGVTDGKSDGEKQDGSPRPRRDMP